MHETELIQVKIILNIFIISESRILNMYTKSNKKVKKCK